MTLIDMVDDMTCGPKVGWIASCVKRLIDLALAAALLVITIPILSFVALAVLATLGRPILFFQRRPGLLEETFVVVKFRTMTDTVDSSGHALPDSERLTRVGRFLRLSSLDELPSLWNVLTGEMSLVGPRPLLMEYLELYSDEQKLRHCVKPGLTGLAQVEGRNGLSWEQKLKLDVWYVQNWSVGLDLSILARTIGVVLGRRGVSAEGHPTMPRFEGDPDES